MAEPNSSFRLLGNSAWNAAAFLIGVGLNLLILPFVVFRLGLAAFGVAGLVTACVAPALAFSNSLALSTVRELAQRLAPDERDDARRFFATALLLAARDGRIDRDDPVFGGPAARPPCVPSEWRARRRSRACFCFRCWRMVVPVRCGGLSGAVYRASGLSAALRRSTSSAPLSRRQSMVVLIPRWPQASTFLGCQALGFATSMLAAFALSRRAIGGWLARPALHRGPLGDLVNLGAWQLAAQGGGLIAGQADRYLLGALLAAAICRILYHRAAARRSHVYWHPESRRNPVPVLSARCKKSPAIARPICCFGPPGSSTCWPRARSAR